MTHTLDKLEEGRKWLKGHPNIAYLAAFFIMGAAIGYGFVTIQNERNSGIVNRAANVETWCDGINEGRDYSRTSVRKKKEAAEKVAALLANAGPQAKPLIKAFLGTAPPYTLKDLPCLALITKTLSSGRRATPVHAHPLVDQALRELKR